MDIVELVRSIRESGFVAQTYLKPHQLALIPNFKEYQIVAVKEANNPKTDKILPDDQLQAKESVAQIEANFSPTSDMIDRNILEKITGFEQGKNNDAEKNEVPDESRNTSTNRNLMDAPLN